ncbi:MAG: sialidase, partial [Bacteroides acidifaciens]|nr:sialidase [Bacteroides acidifaciens]
MKKNLFLSIIFSFWVILQAFASDTVFVRETQIPVLIERQDNVLFMLRLNARESRTLDEVVLNFGKDVNMSDIQSVKLYY